MTGEPPDESPWLIDFFEEGETRENAPAQETSDAASPGTRRPRAMRHGPTPQGVVRARRLALGVGGLLALVVVVTIALSGGSEAGADTSYLAQVAVPARDSQSVGTDLSHVLGTAPSSVSGLETQLKSLLARQRQDLSETASLTAPPKLRAEQQQAVSAMQFRVGGLLGLLKGFQEAAAHPKGVDWASQLSIQADRLIASDVIWSDFFVTPANAQALSDGAKAASAPGSTFVANGNLTAPEAMATVLAVVEHRTAAAAASQNAVLQLGSTGSGVSAYQRELNVWIAKQPGLTKLTVSGVFDQATQTATMAFQTAEKLTADGVVGPLTRAALSSAAG